ncbi:LicD family protein [Collinsella provencensis]|uniref:LicD family protein n=1 Tax=Collinsella provencensis TaxID=1937461 RepID=UPI000C851908|nr:LicD family protein [Collinsella provencensis]
MKGNALDRETPLRKLQLTEFDILKTVLAFCNKNNISWFLDSGTVLGAARHGGFIPWDDDIDIGMLRPDYDRFVELAEYGLPEGYSVHTYSNTHGFAGMFAKVYRDGTRFETQETREAGCPQGIFIDVFPYDALSDNSIEERKQRRSAKFWQSISYLWHSSTIVVPHRGLLGIIERYGCRIAHFVVRCAFSRERIEERFNCSFLKDSRYLPSTRVLPFVWPNIDGYRIDELMPTATLVFEGTSFPVPAKWELYLERMYGDWRALPKPEDRRTHLPLRLVFEDGEVWTAEK